MAIEVVEGTSQKPASSSQLVGLLRNLPSVSGQLFVGYPIVGTPEGPHRIDALLVSANKGIVVFDLIEGTDTNNYAWRQDDSANKLEARLKTHSELMDRRRLRIPIHTISFAPGVSNPRQSAEADYPIENGNSIRQKVESFSWPNNDIHVYRSTLSALENISTIRHTRTKRTVSRDDSRGAKLKRLEDSIATLDNTQSKAVIETVEGVQRIRGLAGSGKTIVLALKAAYLHAQHPDWRIAVTFYTRSLKEYFRRLINNFSLEQTGREPDWDNLTVVNSWGAPGGFNRDGIYYNFCREHDIEYLDFRTAKKMFPFGDVFSHVCERAISEVRDSKPLFDAILVDEAQDFSPAFLRLCYAWLREPKRLVYAYDELQNLSGESLSSPEDIFGRASDGSPVVQFDDPDHNGPRQDIILQKCYRNSRPVLVTAHALGFGIYREASRQNETGLIQLFDNAQLWTEVGYEIRDGALEDGHPVSLQRIDDPSLRFLENHSSTDDLVQFIHFDTEEEQTTWLAREIQGNLEEDELRHDDIIVINPNPRTTQRRVAPVRKLLLDMGINSHLAGVDTSPDSFFQADRNLVTFTGVYRAKGNEGGMVYVINAQDCHTVAGNLATLRNRLFTSITRSRAWVRVLGIGDDMKEIMGEYQRLKNQDFQLSFIYPSAKEREQLRIIHRDMTTEERKRVLNRRRNAIELVGDLEAGNILLEDLDEDVVNRLKSLLG